jgi:hypothetical protein
MLAANNRIDGAYGRPFRDIAAEPLGRANRFESALAKNDREHELLTSFERTRARLFALSLKGTAFWQPRPC